MSRVRVAGVVPRELVAEMETGIIPARMVVPEMSPVVVLSESPAGRMLAA